MWVHQQRKLLTPFVSTLSNKGSQYFRFLHLEFVFFEKDYIKLGVQATTSTIFQFYTTS